MVKDGAVTVRLADWLFSKHKKKKRFAVGCKKKILTLSHVILNWIFEGGGMLIFGIFMKLCEQSYLLLH